MQNTIPSSKFLRESCFFCLRLSGKVILNGKVYDAVSEDGFIEKDVAVKVIRYETGQIYVEKV